jgi:hypothetical protein
MDCSLFEEGSRSGAETHMLISIAAAYLYGVFFVNAIAPDTSEPVLPSAVRVGRRGDSRGARRAPHVDF